jgi:hypothetical protein
MKNELQNNEAQNVPHLYRWRVQFWISGGEHISRLVETQQLQENFSTIEKFSFEPMRYNSRIV